MGKIRIKTLGLPGEEEKEKQKAKTRKGTKKTAKGAHGGERVVSMAPSEEELARLAEVEAKRAKIQVPEEKVAGAPPAGNASRSDAGRPAEEGPKVKPPRVRSQRFKSLSALLDRKKLYPALQALKLLKKLANTHFTETVETHLKIKEKGLRGTVTLPHGTGKKLKVAIANEKILAEIEAGKINFDLLVANQDFMPKLAKVAKILGPKGLMPNPKAGTIGDDPQALVEKFSRGEVQFKTEPEAPLIHQIIGKVDFPEEHLLENLKALVAAVGQNKIEKLTLSSTMGPGIKVNLGSLP